LATKGQQDTRKMNPEKHPMIVMLEEKMFSKHFLKRTDGMFLTIGALTGA
jgi:hypothetical protein